MKLMIGGHDLRSCSAPTCQVVTIVKVVTHPRYSGDKTLRYDVQLVRLVPFIFLEFCALCLKLMFICVLHLTQSLSYTYSQEQFVGSHPTSYRHIPEKARQIATLTDKGLSSLYLHFNTH